MQSHRSRDQTRRAAARTSLLPPLVVALAVLVTLVTTSCDEGVSSPNESKLEVGTWGGENAGVIVNDSLAHVHVGCTFGNFPLPVVLDANGRFTVSGSYLLRAYPIAIGPTLPASFVGTVRGSELTLTVAVNDTVQKQSVTLGPITVKLGSDPKLGPCPICTVVPAMR